MSAPSFQLPLMITTESPCSYLPKELSRSAFVDQQILITPPLYTALLQNGFRRSGEEVYRPYCQACNACIPVRVPVKQFAPNKLQKRVLKKNRDIRQEWLKPPFTDTHYALYASYLEARHQDGGMYPPSREQFDRFLSSSWSNTMALSLFLDEKLVGMMITDLTLDGVSAVYSFFEPELAARSLGIYMVLQLFEEAKRLGLPYCYLGYYIKNCQKMSYKNQYQPMEAFIERQWQILE